MQVARIAQGLTEAVDPEPGNEMETYQRFIRLDQGVEGLLAEIQEALLMMPLGALRLSPLWNHQDWADAYTRTGNLSGRYNQWKRED